MDGSERKAFARAASGPRPIGVYAARTLDPAARARGFASTALLSEWDSIVGAELAAFTMPDRVIWPRRRENDSDAEPVQNRRGDGAVLVLRVDGPRAIEVQHRSDQILERVNTYFGYRAVVEMRILQAPIARRRKNTVSPPLKFVLPPLPPAADRIEDQGLRNALLRLGAAVKAKLTRG